METWPAPALSFSLEVLSVNISSLEEINTGAGDISVATEGVQPRDYSGAPLNPGADFGAALPLPSSLTFTVTLRGGESG